jgi:hypothetical protein
MMEGAHGDLLSLGGLYATLYQRQFRDQEGVPQAAIGVTERL